MLEALSPLLEGRELHPVYETQKEYNEFRERFMARVIPEQEKYEDAHRRSEQEARQRFLK